MHRILQVDLHLRRLILALTTHKLFSQRIQQRLLVPVNRMSKLCWYVLFRLVTFNDSKGENWSIDIILWNLKPMLKYSIERELAKRFGPVHAKVMKPSFYSSERLSDSTGRTKRLKSIPRKRSTLIFWTMQRRILL